MFPWGPVIKCMYILMAKPVKSPELHYWIIQFSINVSYHTLENTARICCILGVITPNLPKGRHAYVSFIMLTSVFSMTWYKFTELALIHQIIYTHSFWYHKIKKRSLTMLRCRVVRYKDTYYLSLAELSRGTLRVWLCKIVRRVFVRQLPNDPLDGHLSL